MAGVAGMFAGAMAMAAGEYVSVASQLDAERTDITREEDELRADPEGERLELERIYQNRGLSPELAAEVAEQLSAGDPLIVHLRDELGIQRERRPDRFRLLLSPRSALRWRRTTDLVSNHRRAAPHSDRGFGDLVGPGGSGCDRGPSGRGFGGKGCISRFDRRGRRHGGHRVDWKRCGRDCSLVDGFRPSISRSKLN